MARNQEWHIGVALIEVALIVMIGVIVFRVI